MTVGAAAKAIAATMLEPVQGERSTTAVFETLLVEFPCEFKDANGMRCGGTWIAGGSVSVWAGAPGGCAVSVLNALS